MTIPRGCRVARREANENRQGHGSRDSVERGRVTPAKEHKDGLPQILWAAPSVIAGQWRRSPSTRTVPDLAGRCRMLEVGQRMTHRRLRSPAAVLVSVTIVLGGGMLVGEHAASA